MQKKLGKGSISLLLVILGTAWSCNLPILDGKCLGDIVLTAIGIPSWTNGDSGLHITVFLSLIFFIPAFILGIRNKGDRFAKAGMWISGIFCGSLLVMGSAMLLFSGIGKGGSYEIIYGTVKDHAMARMNEYDFAGHSYIGIERDDGTAALLWFENRRHDCDAQIGDYVMIEAEQEEGSEYKFAAKVEVLSE